MHSDDQLIGDLVLELQVATCYLSCKHCYAGNFTVKKQQMLLEDVLACVKFFAAITTAKPTVYLYKDLLDYHDRAAFLQALRSSDLHESVELLPTHGRVKDGYDLTGAVSVLAQNGVRRVWLTLHGFREEHDNFVRRRGGFDNLLRFSAVARNAGIGVDWNLMARKSNIGQLAGLLRDPLIRSLSDNFYVSVPGHLGYGQKLSNDRPSIEAVRVLEDLGALPSTNIFSEAVWIDRLVRLRRLSDKCALQPYAEIRVMPDFSVWLHDFPTDRYIGSVKSDTTDTILKRILSERSLVAEIKDTSPTDRLLEMCRQYGDLSSNDAHCIYSIASVWSERRQKKSTHIVSTKTEA